MGAGSFKGKTRGQIAAALNDAPREKLLDIIFSLSTVEEHFTPAEIAGRSKMSKSAVYSDIRRGRFGGEYFKRSSKQVTVSASGVNAWRSSFRVVVPPR